MDRNLLKEARLIIRADSCICGAYKEDFYYETAEIDGREATQNVSCMECERHWTEVYQLSAVIIEGERIELKHIL